MYSSSNETYIGLYRGLEDYFLSWYLIVNLVIGVIGGLFCLIFILLSRLFPINVRIWMVCISLGNVGILLFDALRMEVKVLSPEDFDIRDINLLWCRFHLFFSNYFFYWSAYMQTCLSLQRLYFIWFPLKARYILRTRFIVVALIVISLLLILPLIPYFLWHIGETHDCEPPGKILYVITTVLDTVIWVGIPFLLMSISTALIAYKISSRTTPKVTSGPSLLKTQTPSSEKNHSKESHSLKERQLNHRVSSKAERQVTLTAVQCHGGRQDRSEITRLLVGLNIFYIITTFPLLIYSLFLDFYFNGNDVPKQLRKFIYYLLRSLCYLNSAFSWIFYFLTGKMFRDRVMKSFPCLRRFCICFPRDGQMRNYSTSTAPSQASRQLDNHVVDLARVGAMDENEEQSDSF